MHKNGWIEYALLDIEIILEKFEHKIIYSWVKAEKVIHLTEYLVQE